MGFSDQIKSAPIWAKALIGVALIAIMVTAIAVPIALTAPDAPATATPVTETPTTTQTAPTSSPSSTSKPTTTATTKPTTTIPPPSNIDQRIECFPFRNMTEQTCTASGCLWDETNHPNCFLPDSTVYGYEIFGDLVNLPDGAGFTVDVRRRRKQDGAIIFSLYGGDYDEVTFEVNYLDDNSLRFQFYPTRAVERSTIRRPPTTITIPSARITEQVQYEVKLESEEKGQPFNFQILRKSSGAVIFDTSIGGLTIAEQFLMISTKLPTPYLYGFGENTHDTLLHDMQYRMWPIFSRGASPGREDLNVYGAQPFYMAAEEDNSFHGVFLYNSHAMDVTTMPSPGLTFRTIGGMFEFFVFLGPKPETVIQQYSKIIGTTFMPPYFALGFQLSRWGYQRTENIKKVIENNRALNIPQDIQYADIDYMDGRKDFTIDPTNFADLPQLVDQVKAEGIKFVVILDPAIAKNYGPFRRGQQQNVFVKWSNTSYIPDNQNDDVLYGRVWPRQQTAFPDFFKTSTKNWWTQEIITFHNQLKFDALWIDMNEPSNFLTGTLLQCPENKWDDPPYGTMAAHVGITQRLSEKTICMASRFGENDKYLHYDVHNVYGYSHAIATQSAARQALTGQRSMVLSRSTFAGSGSYAGHWLGDNFSTWTQMAKSIIGILEFNMFNIPYVGADICGFTLNAEERLCERWMELGAFYPFSRNHNNIFFRDQDPAQWPETVAVSSRKALNIRYRLLPYLYSLFYDSHINGGTVARPLFHEYPGDIKARSIDKQFLWGPAFLISPVLEQDKTTVDVYIPEDVWYDYYTGIRLTETGDITLQAPRDHINLHLRGGYILPAQKPDLNTLLSRLHNFELLVPLNDENSANGKLFWDDGNSVDTLSSGSYQINSFEFKTDTLTIIVEKGSPSWSGIFQELDNIEIMGLPNQPESIEVNGLIIPESEFKYDVTKKLLRLTHIFSMNIDYEVKFL